MALPKPQKDYYCLEEVAEEWGWSLSTLIHYAEKGKVKISIWLKRTVAKVCEFEYHIPSADTTSKNEYETVILEGIYSVLPSQLDELLNNGHSYWSLSAEQRKGDDLLNGFREYVAKNVSLGMSVLYQDRKTLCYTHFPSSLPYKEREGVDDLSEVKCGYYFDNYSDPIAHLGITPEEKTRVEEELGQELPLNEQESFAEKQDYLTLDHPCFSSELCDAVTAWRQAVKQTTDPLKFKAIARRWLEECGGYSGKPLERISVLVNPDKGKTGGARKRDE